MGIIYFTYQPKMSQLKEANEAFKKHINNMSPEDRTKFINSLDDKSKSYYDYGMDQMDQMNQWQFQQQVEEFNRFSMEEGMRSVTPFDHGGYVMGNGFNPSDTVAFEHQNSQVDHSFNTMNDNFNTMNDTSSFDHMNNF
jgi:hypothetical protein